MENQNIQNECKPKKKLTYHKENWREFTIDTIEMVAIYTIIYVFLAVVQNNFEVFRHNPFLRNITGLILIKFAVELVFEEKKNVYIKNMITILILIILFDMFKVSEKSVAHSF